MVKLLKLEPEQKRRIMEILDNGGSEEEINEYLMTCLPQDFLQAEATKIISRSQGTKTLLPRAEVSSTRLH